MSAKHAKKKEEIFFDSLKLNRPKEKTKQSNHRRSSFDHNVKKRFKSFLLKIHN